MFRLGYVIVLLLCSSAWAEMVVWGSNQTLPLDQPITNIRSETLASSHLIYDPLLSFNHEGELEGCLVKEWERLSPTQFKLTLRQGVQFHSGNLLTAEDVEWSFSQHKLSPSLATYFASIKELKKVGVNTLILELYQPIESPLRSLSNLFVYDSQWQRRSINIHRTASPALLASGSGPFILKEHHPGIRSQLERNYKYWGGFLGNIDRLTIVPIINPIARLLALTSGDVDIVNGLLPEHQSMLFQASNFDAIPIDAADWVGLSFNTINPILQLAVVREAIGAAIDRLYMAAYLFEELAHPAYQLSYSEPVVKHLNMVTTGEANNMLYRNLPLNQRGPIRMDRAIPIMGAEKAAYFDPLLAQKLLHDADVVDDLQLQLVVPDYLDKTNQAAQLIQQMLSRVNIKLEIMQLGEEDYKRALKECRGDLFLITAQGKKSDLPGRIRDLAFDKNVAHCQASENGAMLSGLDPQKHFIDSADYMNRLQSVQKHLLEETLILPLYWQPELWGVNQKLRGFSISTEMGGPRFDHIYVIDLDYQNNSEKSHGKSSSVPMSSPISRGAREPPSTGREGRNPPKR